MFISLYFFSHHSSVLVPARTSNCANYVPPLRSSVAFFVTKAMQAKVALLDDTLVAPLLVGVEVLSIAFFKRPQTTFLHECLRLAGPARMNLRAIESTTRY